MKYFRLSLSVFCLGLLLTPLALRADVKIRPGDKMKESTKDFIKDAKKNGYPTPEPHDRTFTFTTGLSVDVELAVATSFLGNVKFTIQNPPQFGKLSEIRAHPSGESNKAMVTYTHNGDPDQISDRFTFQAKIGDGNTSAPGVITLMGKRAAAKLEVLDAPRFRRLQPGEQDAGRIVLLNSGTAPFSGEIKWPAPFIGPPTLELAINEKQTVMLSIKPLKPGAYRVDQELQPGVPTSKVQAYVECVQAFSAAPGLVNLQFDAAKSKRYGTIKVSNASPSPLLLKLDFPKRLKLPESLTLDPNASQDVTVELDPQDVAQFHGEVWFIQEPHREKVVIHADPEPAQISLESPADGVLDFGKIEKGKPGENHISLINVGGIAAVLKLTNASPFIAPAAAGSVVIEPGKSQSIAVNFTPDQPGSFNSTFTIGGNAGIVEVKMKGSMVDPRRPASAPASEGISNPNLVPMRPRPTTTQTRESTSAPKAKAPEVAPPTLPVTLSKVPVAAPQTAETHTTPAPDDSSDAPKEKKSSRIPLSQLNGQSMALLTSLSTFGFMPEQMPEMKSPVLEAVQNIGLKDVGSDYVVLSWSTPKLEPKQYLIQTSEKVFNKATGMILKSWKNVEGWKLQSTSAGTAAAQLNGLQPNAEYEWRILGVDENGKFSPPSDILQVLMPVNQSWPAWAWILIVGVLSLSAVLVMRRIREQRGLA